MPISSTPPKALLLGHNYKLIELRSFMHAHGLYATYAGRAITVSRQELVVLTDETSPEMPSMVFRVTPNGQGDYHYTRIA